MSARVEIITRFYANPLAILTVMGKEKLYFIRIGGTAMGGVAVACRQTGHEVYGSEPIIYEPMKSYLAHNDIPVLSEFSASKLIELNPDLVVIGNAVSRGNAELEYVLERKLDYISLPELVAKTLIGKKTSVVIAGTHGKTTTTSMVTNMLQVGGLAPGFMIGGVPGNFEVSCRPAEGDVFVIEGDEYDSAYYDKRSKFLHYRPDIAVVNNLEFDHADIFDSLEAIKKSFRLFIRLVPRNGVVLANGDDPNVVSILQDACSPVETFGFSENCHWRVVEFEEGERGSRFTVEKGGLPFGTFVSPANGEFNILNMTVAIAIGHRLGLSQPELELGTATYLSPQRRMQEVGDWNGALVIDDFGHHPTAIKGTLDALRHRYPNRRILACFEPRSNTTTRSFFQRELTECFGGVAGVAIGALDRPERYNLEERLDANKIIEELGVPGISISVDQGKDAEWGRHIADWLESQTEKGDLIAIFSNGDFGGLRTILRSQAS